MSASILPEDWLRFIDREYLSKFIADGGTAIKFAVPMEETLRSQILKGLSAISSQSGYLVVHIDALYTRVNMIDEIFFRTAQQVPWRDLSKRIIAKLAADSGYMWTDEIGEPLYETLARHNRVEPQVLLLDLKKAIGSNVFKKQNLAKDFRVAMTHMCLAELCGGPEGSAGIEALTAWLTGKNKALSAVKQFQIFRRMNRNTARYFLESLVSWVKFSGYAGTVILLDMERLMLNQRPQDQSLFYTKPALLDAYELLRQFIDASDRMDGCLVTVIPDFAFLEDRGRGVSAYEALKFRVFDEVRDKDLVNPMASLARLSMNSPARRCYDS